MAIDTIAKNESFLLKLDAMRGPVPYPAFNDGRTALVNTFYLHNDLQSTENDVLINEDDTPINLSVGWANGQWEHRVKVVSANNYDRLWIAAQYGDRFGRTVRLKVRDKYYIDMYAPATIGCGGYAVYAYIFTLEDVPAVHWLGYKMEFFGHSAGVEIRTLRGSAGCVGGISDHEPEFEILAYTRAEDSRIPVGETWYGVYVGDTRYAPCTSLRYKIISGAFIDEAIFGVRVTTEIVDGQTVVANILRELDCPPTPSPSPCPVDCSGCPDPIITLSGFSGGTWGAGACSLSDINGAQATSRVGCTWTTVGVFATCAVGPPVAQVIASIACAGTTWTIIVDTVGPGATGPIATFTAPNTTGCPPATGWSSGSGGSVVLS